MIVTRNKTALTLGLLVAAIVAGVFLSGYLTLLLLFGFKHHASLGPATYWQYVQALQLPQVAPYAGRIRIAGVIGFGLPALLWLVLLYPIFKPRRRSLHGDARFAKRGDIARAKLLDDDPMGIVIGRFDGDLLRLSGAQHVILTAPTRSGKTAGVAIPVLLTYQGSVVALDIKGELYAATSGWRASQGQRVFVWAPYAEDRRGHRFNPLQCVSAQPELRTSQIQSIAASLYPDDPNKDSFWIQQARNAFFGFASYMYERWDADVRTLHQAGVPRDGWSDPNTSPGFPSFEWSAFSAIRDLSRMASWVMQLANNFMPACIRTRKLPANAAASLKLPARSAASATRPTRSMQYIRDCKHCFRPVHPGNASIKRPLRATWQACRDLAISQVFTEANRRSSSRPIRCSAARPRWT